MSSVLYMSMSLDGFVAGPNEGPGNGLGDGGPRLHEWAFPRDEAGQTEVPSGVSGQVFDEMLATGAVVAGRRTFELADGWGGDHHDGVPIFIVTSRPPSQAVAGWPLVTYVNDVETAMARAKEAAGDKDVLVHGAGTAPLALAAGVLDELEIHLDPGAVRRGTQAPRPPRRPRGARADPDPRGARRHPSPLSRRPVKRGILQPRPGCRWPCCTRAPSSSARWPGPPIRARQGPHVRRPSRGVRLRGRARVAGRRVTGYGRRTSPHRCTRTPSASNIAAFACRARSAVSSSGA